MIYITQLIFIKEGKEEVFHEFEDFAITLMEKYNGRIIYRIRPKKSAYVTSNEDQPYKIHFIFFNTENDLNNFMKDDTRLELMHLKDESVKSTLLVKGESM